MTRFDEVTVGEAMPPLVLPVTLQRLVMEAGVNRDYSPIHFDRDAARAAGAPDVFANTTFVEALLEATLRRWAGLDGRIRVLDFSMRDFTCVGDVVTVGGVVTGMRDSVAVDLEIWIDAGHRRTVAGTAVVELP